LDRPVFSRDFYRELAAENPFGLTLHWREVEAWFNYIAWPAYKTYHYKRHQVAVRRWWARCHMRDLERAREAMENADYEEACEQQAKLLDAEVDQMFADKHNPQNRRILRKIMGGGGVRQEQDE